MDKAKKQDLLVKLVCLLLACALWIFTISSENVEINVRIPDVPVKILNAESLKKQNLILLPENNPNTTISIKGPANSVYSAKSTDFGLYVDLSTVTLTEGENKVPVNADRLPSNTSLSGSAPEVTIITDRLMEKSVDIKKDNITYSPAPGFYVPEPILDSTVSIVTGPEEYVNKVAALTVNMNKTDISGLTKEAKRVIPVDENGEEVPNVTSSKSYVEVTFNAWAIKEVPVKVTYKNSVDQAIKIKQYLPNPSTVKVTARDSILRNLTLIETEPLDLSEIRLQTVQYPIKLAVPQDVILLDQEGKAMEPDITVNIAMDSYENREIEKPVTTEGTPLSPVTLDTDKVKIILSGTPDKLNALNVNDITASVNVDGLKPGLHDVEVKVTAPVDYLVKIITPNKVKVKVGP